MTEFVKNLKELRKQHNVSQEQLSTLLGGKKTSIVNVENKGAEPSPELLLSLSSFFDVSVDYLLGNTRIVENNSCSHDIPLHNLNSVLSLNKNKPCWFRYITNKTYSQYNNTLYLQEKENIEFYDPSQYSTEGNRIYLEFINCLTGNYSENFYNFFCKYGYLGKTKSTHSFQPYAHDISLIETVFNDSEYLAISPNQLTRILPTNRLNYFAIPHKENISMALKYTNEGLSTFEFNQNNRFKIQGYYETYDCNIAYAMEMKSAIFGIVNNEYSDLEQLINYHLSDIIPQISWYSGNPVNTFVYTSLMAYMYMELLIDIQNGIYPKKCSTCSRHILCSKEQSPVCDDCYNLGIRG